jgi:hypothetical protein
VDHKTPQQKQTDTSDDNYKKKKDTSDDETVTINLESIFIYSNTYTSPTPTFILSTCKYDFTLHIYFLFVQETETSGDESVTL